MSLKQNVRNKKVLVSYKTELHTSTQKPQNFKNKRKICVKLINCVETLLSLRFWTQHVVETECEKQKNLVSKKN